MQPSSWKIVLSWAAFVLLGLRPGLCAREETPANALLLLPSDNTAFDAKFQAFLAEKDAKLLQSFPPAAFIGYIPRALDAELERKYGALVYREKIDDMFDFFKRGESAVFAVNAWNKRFVEDPPSAPAVVSSKVNQARNGAKLILRWNSVMKAGQYRLQISSSSDFSPKLVETLTEENFYTVCPSFFPEGVYYWRVAGLLTLNTGAKKEGPMSAVYSFAVPKPGAPKGKKASRRSRPPARPVMKDGVVLVWAKAPGCRRLQISETADFRNVLIDEMTDSNSRRLDGPALEAGGTYFARLAASDGGRSGPWSAAAGITRSWAK